MPALLRLFGICVAFPVQTLGFQLVHQRVLDKIEAFSLYISTLCSIRTLYPSVPFYWRYV